MSHRPANRFKSSSAAGGISGGFDAINLPALAGGLYFDLGYTTNTITLSVAGMVGDYNRSGDIDAADYVVWRKTMSQSGPALAADGNNNGVIDGADFAVWRANFGNSSGIGSGTSPAAIPEPTTFALALLLVTFALTNRRVSRGVE